MECMCYASLKAYSQWSTAVMVSDERSIPRRLTRSLGSRTGEDGQRRANDVDHGIPRYTLIGQAPCYGIKAEPPLWLSASHL